MEFITETWPDVINSYHSLFSSILMCWFRWCAFAYFELLPSVDVVNIRNWQMWLLISFLMYTLPNILSGSNLILPLKEKLTQLGILVEVPIHLSSCYWFRCSLHVAMSKTCLGWESWGFKLSVYILYCLPSSWNKI